MPQSSKQVIPETLRHFISPSEPFRIFLRFWTCSIDQHSYWLSLLVIIHIGHLSNLPCVWCYILEEFRLILFSVSFCAIWMLFFLHLNLVGVVPPLRFCKLVTQQHQTNLLWPLFRVLQCSESTWCNFSLDKQFSNSIWTTFSFLFSFETKYSKDLLQSLIVPPI